MGRWGDFILTSYVQLDGIALAVALPIAAHAGVDATSGPTGVLEHQTLVGHGYAFGGIVGQNLTLKSKAESEMLN